MSSRRLSNHDRQGRRRELRGLLSTVRIGVLAGGTSAEAEISREAARCICDALIRVRLAFRRIEVTERLDVRKLEDLDVVVNVLYGEFGEGGSVRAVLETLGVASTYSGIEASARALDKWRTKLIVAANGVPCTWTVVADPDAIGSAIDATVARSRGPYVCKPLLQGSSVGVSFADNSDALTAALARGVALYGSYIIEPFLPGREFSVAILETTGRPPEALPILEAFAPRGASFVDQSAKYGPNTVELRCPAVLGRSKASRLKDLALTAYRAIGCYPLARIDFREDLSGEPQLLEVNHFPGMTPRSWLPIAAAQAGFSFDDVVLELVASALERRPPPLLTRLSSGARLEEFPRHPIVVVVPPDHADGITESPPSPTPSLHAPVVPFDQTFRRALSGTGPTRVLDCLGDEAVRSLAHRGACDALGIARIGPSLLTCALANDKLVQKHVASAEHLPTPEWALLSAVSQSCEMGFPCIVKPRRASGSHRVHYVSRLSEWVSLTSALQSTADEWLVEEFIPGAEYCVGLLSLTDRRTHVLPILEVLLPSAPPINDASNKAVGNAASICPAEIDPELRTELVEASVRAHRVFGHSPFARVEWRLDRSGQPRLIEYDHTPGLGARSYIPLMLEVDGLTLEEAVDLVVAQRTTR